jgi:hypothetical protein
MVIELQEIEKGRQEIEKKWQEIEKGQQEIENERRSLHQCLIKLGEINDEIEFLEN